MSTGTESKPLRGFVGTDLPALMRQVNYQGGMSVKNYGTSPVSGVTELDPTDPRATVCGHCGRGWDDSVSTDLTPVPAGRCPFEYQHEYVETCSCGAAATDDGLCDSCADLDELKVW